MSAPAPGTPLPWDASPAGKNMRSNYSQSYCVNKWPEPVLMAGCFCDIEGGEDAAEANARYIVWSANNAPSLLEALQRLVSAIAYVDAIPGDKGAEILAAAHAAIAKATGAA